MSVPITYRSQRSEVLGVSRGYKHCAPPEQRQVSQIYYCQINGNNILGSSVFAPEEQYVYSCSSA